MTLAEINLRKELGLDVPGAGQKNYSVKAGAGGGKTTLLSRRIANQIIQGTPIDEFVIITYTNAAAAELREKITNRLQEVVNSGTQSAAALKYAQDALNSIELMQISTIHAFLFRILREYAFEAGIVMDAKMLEGEEDTARKKAFFDQWYHLHFDEIEKFRDDWIHVSEKGKKSEHHREVFENMFMDIANVREEIIYDLSDHTAEFTKAAEDYLNTWVPRASTFVSSMDLIAPAKKDGTKILLKGAEEVIAGVTEVESDFNNGNKGVEQAKKLAVAFKAALGVIKAKGKYFYGKNYQTQEDQIAHLLPIRNVQEHEWNFAKIYESCMSVSEKAARVAEYVCKMQKEYQKQIDAETLVLSNDDILYRAEKLLLEHGDILDKLREKYTKIYVDEFQDTTDLQTRIIKLLSEKSGADLTNIDFSQDKLLVVGDAKQSIYRFTGAEKSVYDDVDQLMNSLPNTLAESVNLESNFRSNSVIVDWVNKSYDGSATGSPAGLMKDYTAMSTDWVVSNANALHGVYRYGDPAVACKRDEDVENVVNLVETLVNNPKYFVERVTRSQDGSSTTPVLNTIQYSDIMIICKNTTHMESYVNAFYEKGIPVNVQGKFMVKDDEVLRNYVLLVEYFAEHKNKKNRVTAAQILHGIDVSKVDASVLTAAENALRGLRVQFRKEGMDVAAVAQHLLRHEDLYIPKDKSHKVERVRSYRIRLHQMVETCLGKNSGDLSELVRIMKEYLDTEVKREIPLESNENAIRLMNAHQSKGLTGQIVIIADRSNNEECRYGGFKKSGKYYPAATFKHNSFGDSKTITVPAYGYDMTILKQAGQDEIEEAIRLQYVAATRAAHALIIMPVCSSRNVPWFTDAAYELAMKPDICTWLKERDEDTTVYPVIGAGASATHPVVKLEDLEANLAAADFTQLTENQITSITPSGLEPAGVTGCDARDAEYVKENRPSGNVFGTVMHRVYELIFSRYETISGLAAADQEKAVKRIIHQAILEQTDELRATDHPQEFLEFLYSVMVKYLPNVIDSIVKEAEDVTEIYPEYTFSFYVSDAEREQFLKDFEPYFQAARTAIQIGSEKIWVNGQADLVVRKKDGTVKVYDYKSDAMNGKALADFEKSLAEKYEGQLALYRYAIGKAFDVTDVETELIHLYK